MITWEQGKYSGQHAEVNGIRIGSIHWSVTKSPDGKPYTASFDLPGYKVKSGLHFTEEEAKACVERIWNKWLARVTQSKDAKS